MKKQVLNTQSLLDIALQELGDISGIFGLLEQCKLSITDELTAGSKLDIAEGGENKQVTNYYLTHSITPATGITANNGGSDLLSEGIELSGIEYDFIVN